MTLETTIGNAFQESAAGVRKGDNPAELAEIRKYLLASRVIVVPNHNGVKIGVINEILEEYGLPLAKHLAVPTGSCDVSRMPALTKALMALDISDADLVIARGRLGVPGSGSMLVILDRKGRILSAALSPAHVLHGKTVAQAVRDEMREALSRLGFPASRDRGAR